MTRAEITRAVRRWYRRNGRSLPWRGSDDAYHVLLSEIMLQQTQVSRVLVKFPEFLRQFPTLKRLAAADSRDVVVAWRGMGYNNRAVRLHSLAKILVRGHGGRLPGTQEELRSLPGIGRYTAAALLSSVHGLREPVVDVNVRRFFSRLLYRMPTLDAMAGEDAIWAAAFELLPSRRVYEWNQALMDFGALMCTSRHPACDRCPVKAPCMSRPMMRRVRRARRKTERTHLGVPYRIYRGRIVEHLRAVKPPRGLSDATLGRRVFRAYAASERKLLHALLTALERDGIVSLRRTGDGIRASLA